MAPESLAGHIDHTYNNAGNRTERSSDIPLVGGQTLAFDSRYSTGTPNHYLYYTGEQRDSDLGM